jgi:hypothetical protein
MRSYGAEVIRPRMVQLSHSEARTRAPPWRNGQPRRTGDAGPALGAAALRFPAEKFKVVSRVGDSELAATSHACGWNEAVKSSSAERVAT